MCVQFWTFFLLGRLFFDTKKHAQKKEKEREREREREREKKKSVGVALRACWIYTIKKCALGEIKSQYSSCVVVREEEEEEEEEETLVKE